MIPYSEMDWFPFAWAGFLIGVVGMGIVTYLTTTPNVIWHEEAMKHGCAEYYLDNKHQAQWRWKN